MAHIKTTISSFVLRIRKDKFFQIEVWAIRYRSGCNTQVSLSLSLSLVLWLCMLLTYEGCNKRPKDPTETMVPKPWRNCCSSGEKRESGVETASSENGEQKKKNCDKTLKKKFVKKGTKSDEWLSMRDRDYWTDKTWFGKICSKALRSMATAFFDLIRFRLLSQFLYSQ